MKKFLVAALLLGATVAQAIPNSQPQGFMFYGDQTRRWTLPYNTLHLRDGVNANPQIDEKKFNDIIDGVAKFYEPIAKAHGITFKFDKLWNDATVNAQSYQQGKTWFVEMYGGLARRPEVTPDGFALVVCHEIGHHLGGYPYVSGWAADEGEADYYATLTCARLVWGRDQQANLTWRGLRNIPQDVATQCATAWPNNTNAQGWCVRTSAASLSLATLLGALGGNPPPKFETPDKKVVSKTNHDHPEAQCRLDTYMAGATCTKTFDYNVIPGALGANTAAAETDSAKYSCYTKDGFAIGARPLCWFKPLR